MQLLYTCSIHLCKYLFLYLETKYLQCHVKLSISCHLNIRHVRLLVVYLHGELPEVKSASNLPMLQANSSSSPSDPAQMVKLFAKFWDQVSWMFFVLKKKIIIFQVDVFYQVTILTGIFIKKPILGSLRFLP